MCARRARKLSHGNLVFFRFLFVQSKSGTLTEMAKARRVRINAFFYFMLVFLRYSYPYQLLLDETSLFSFREQEAVCETKQFDRSACGA